MRRRILFAVTAATVLSTASFSNVALAGSNGQQLSLRDVKGYIYSALVSGYNNNCQVVDYGISNWAGHDYDISGLYWQAGYCQSGSLVGLPYTYASTNYQGYEATFTLANPVGPPHSQSSAWWSCELDDIAMACKAGKDAYG
jgi:hypothetical protein